MVFVTVLKLSKLVKELKLMVHKIFLNFKYQNGKQNSRKKIGWVTTMAGKIDSKCKPKYFGQF